MQFKKEKLEWLYNIAQEVRKASKDQSTKIGALIFDDNYTILSTGYNSFPRGINDNLQERQDRPEKYFWFEHAERNAIYNAVRSHADIRNANMLLTCGVPCADCARGVIQASIKNVICYKGAGPSLTNEGAKLIWNESVKRSETMFKESGVDTFYYEDILAV